MLKSFEKCFTRLAQATDEDLQDIIHQLSEDQPALLAYIMVAGEDFMGEWEIEALLYLALTISLTFKAELGDVRPVTDIEIDRVESRNMKLFERLAGSEGEDFIREVDAAVEGSPHSELLVFVADLIIDPDFEIDPANRGFALTCIKIFLDALSAAYQK